MYRKYFNFDQITDIQNKIKPLVGCVIMSDDNELFLLKSFDIGSKEIDTSGFFEKKKMETMFCIDHMEFVSNSGTFKHTANEDSEWCTTKGVNQLLEDRQRYLEIKNKIVEMATIMGEPIIHFPVEEKVND